MTNLIFMDLLTYPKTEFFLDPSLEVLHMESVDWLKKLDFWADELSLFHKLVHSQLVSHIFPTAQVAVIDKTLMKLDAGTLEDLRKTVGVHEQHLALICVTPEEKAEQIRESHRSLLTAMYELHREIRALKREVFSFIYK